MPSPIQETMQRLAAFRLARIRALRRKGLSLSQIATKLDISKQRVSQILLQRKQR